VPGLFGITASNRTDTLQSAFSGVFTPAIGTFQSESLIDPQEQWAIGRTHLGVLQPSLQLQPSENIQVLFHGDLHNAADLAARLHIHEAGTRRDSSLVGALYRRFGVDFAVHLEGAYCVAIVDSEQHRVVLVSDAVGSYPLYWTTAGGALAFASELRALLRHGGVQRHLDPRAVADYIAFGFPFGTKTLAAGVQLLPAGSTLMYDWDTRATSIQRVSDMAEAFQPWEGTESDYTDAVVDAFGQSVGRSLAGDHPFGLSLSGGLDSRAILSAVNGARSTLATYTLGVKGCADEVIAERLARIAGTRHSFFELDNKYLRDFLPNLERMVSLTDGMYLSHGLTEMLALHFLSSADFSVLVRGHGGELAKAKLAWPLHTDEQVYTFGSSRELIPYLLQRVNYISPGLQPQNLFTDEWAAQIAGGAQASMEQALAGVPLVPADLCSYLYLMEQHRRYTTASLELFRQVVEIRLPFIDLAFMKVLLRGQSRWRDDTRLHRALTSAGSPKLLRVRNSNTGAPGNAGPLVEFGFDKMNTLFKRLNVPGYRHYHNFQAWMQQQLFASLETVLLSPESLDRGMLRESGVRQMVDDTRTGRSDHSYLLQVLLILELWQRENM
jgi:asparagine synthase (glutamine-hydrolysing)